MQMLADESCSSFNAHTVVVDKGHLNNHSRRMRKLSEGTIRLNPAIFHRVLHRIERNNPTKRWKLACHSQLSKLLLGASCPIYQESLATTMLTKGMEHGSSPFRSRDVALKERQPRLSISFVIGNTDVTLLFSCASCSSFWGWHLMLFPPSTSRDPKVAN